MDNAFFANQKTKAISCLNQKITDLNNEEKKKLVNIYDTNSGSDWHNYRVNQRAEQNGRVNREYSLRTNEIYNAINLIEEAQNPDELWSKLIQECFFLDMSCKKEGGGVDWKKAKYKATEFQCENTWEIWNTVYSHFWN